MVLGIRCHREVIEHFSIKIKERWQFQKFYDDNPEIAYEFYHTVHKMITSKERTREWFPTCNQQDNRDNRGYDSRGNQGGQPSRKCAPDNTLVSMDKSKKPSMPKRFEDLQNLSCLFHKNA